MIHSENLSRMKWEAAEWAIMGLMVDSGIRIVYTVPRFGAWHIFPLYAILRKGKSKHCVFTRLGNGTVKAGAFFRAVNFTLNRSHSDRI